MSIILTGSTGRIGSLVLKYLLTLVPASKIILSVYNPAGVSEDVKKSGVEIRGGDYTKPETLEEAFKGGEKLFLVSVPSPQNQERVEKHKLAIDAAKKAGVKHIYYTSLAFTDNASASIFLAHHTTEEYLKASGVTYTIIREGLYSEYWPLYLGFFNPYVDDHIVLTHDDGPVAFTAVEDLGEATAKILAEDGWENVTVTLNAQKTYTLKETADLVPKIIGKEIPVKYVSDEEWLQIYSKKSLAKLWIAVYHSFAKGEAGKTDPTLEKILGRPPVTFEEVVKRRLDLESYEEIVGRGDK